MRIGFIERRIIELIKDSKKVQISMIDKDMDLSIDCDKQFAHDIALAYQGLVIRNIEKRDRKTE